MKKAALLLIVLSIFLNTERLHSQNPKTNDTQICFGIRDAVKSKILNEKRNILVYIPSSASSPFLAKQTYPVVYLLDGGVVHFTSVVSLIRTLNSAYSCPEMIVIGIPNTDRTRDLTTSHMENWQFLGISLGIDALKTSGGNENFIAFIEKELIPHVDSLYPTAPYRMLLGHSFGGLTVFNAMANHTNLFNAYIAVDPALSWDNFKVLNQFKAKLASGGLKGVSLYMGIPNTMGEGMDTIKVMKDNSISTEHFRSIFELKNLLSSSKGSIRFGYKYYPNDNHISVLPITEHDAFRFFFSNYRFDFFKANEYNNIEEIFKRVSKDIGYSMKPPEPMVNILGYQYLSFNYWEAALFLFRLNTTLYPDSPNAFDSLGEFYEKKGDKANAIDCYKKALLILEMPYTRKKLDNLLKK